MNEQDVELARVETELQREETGLHTEIARLTVQSEELTGRVEKLKAIVAEAEAAGAHDAVLAERVRKAALPYVDPNLSFDRARQFRRASANARREANQAVRQTITGWKEQVAHLGEQVKADEPLVQKLAAQGQQKKVDATKAAADAAKLSADRAAAAKKAVELAEADAATQSYSPTLLRMPGPTDGLQVEHLPPPIPGGRGGVHVGGNHASGVRTNGAGGNGVGGSVASHAGGNGALAFEVPALPPPRATDPMFPPQSAASKEEKSKKRVSQRVRMQAAVDLHSDNNFFQGFSSNISDGGLFVATVNLMPIGTEVEVMFTLPGSGAKISAQGVVRWRREVDDHSLDAIPGLGVQFTSLEPSAHSAITRFLAEREPMFYVD